MNQKVSEYIKGKEKQRKKAQEEFLIQEGLYEKIYLANDELPENDEDFDYQWDEENGIARYFKKTAIEVTDEEFEKIKAAYESTKKESKEVNETMVYNNNIASALKTIAVLSFVLGAITTIICFTNELVGIGLGVLAATFIEGMLFLGFGEVIDLLNDIRNK